MAKKVTTASVDGSHREIAEQALKHKQSTGMINSEASVQSVSDEGDFIMVYTDFGSFGVKKNARSSTAG